MNGIKVAIVEDDAIIAMDLEILLSEIGYSIVGVFSSGESFIKALEQNLIADIVFMDIILQGDMDGVETMDKINKSFDVPVIYLTSSTDENTIKEAKKTNPLAFIAKPFDAFQLQTTLDVALHSKQVQREDSKKKKYLLNAMLKENQKQSLYMEELKETNAHLVTATWRERELKQQLHESLEELTKTKEIVDKQNTKIADSINYAKRIQRATIPTSKMLTNALGKYFMFYKAKDVVSGDFPWLFERDGYIYLAVVDCTGHGVPGAMMALISSVLLNDVVNNEAKCKTPAEILNELHVAIVKTLRQDLDHTNSSDGLDIALCRIDKNKGELLFSGAHRPLYSLENGALKQYKGDKYPIGGMQYKGKNTFINQKVKLSKGNSVYLFSDGLPDQFGQDGKGKFGPKRIRKLIVENKDKEMGAMKEVFYNAFNNWMGNAKQIDDVLLIGIQF